MSPVPKALGLICAFSIAVGVVGCAPDDVKPSASPTVSTSLAPTASTEPEPSPSTPAPSTPTTAPDGRTSVTVVLVTFGPEEGGLYASALVPDVVEAGGTCTLTATNGSQTLTSGVDAVAATTSMNCGATHIDAGPGDWTITMTYESVDSTGTSETEQVIVP